MCAAAPKSPQLCPTLCDPIDSSPPGSAIPGILQARTLEWGAISFSSAWKWKVKVKSVMSKPQRPHGLQPIRLLHPWDFPGKSTGVGCHCLLHSYNSLIISMSFGGPCFWIWDNAVNFSVILYPFLWTEGSNHVLKLLQKSHIWLYTHFSNASVCLHTPSALEYKAETLEG